MPTLENLTARIQEAKQLDFGDILSESLALFKKTWVQGLLLQVLTGAVFIPVVLLMYLFFFGIIIGQLGNDYTDPNFVRGLLAGASVLGVLCFGIGVFLLLVAPTALTAAYFRIMKKLDYNEDVGFSDFFYFFKGRNLLKITTLLFF